MVWYTLGTPTVKVASVECLRFCFRDKHRETDRQMGWGRGRVRPAETELEELLTSGFQGFSIILSDRVKKEPGSEYHISVTTRAWVRGCGPKTDH